MDLSQWRMTGQPWTDEPHQPADPKDQTPSAPAPAPDAPLGPADSQILDADPDIDRALVELRRAVNSRRPEAVCAAYLTLHRLLKGRKAADLFDRAQRACGQQVKDVVVSAFSHRGCFMCSDGLQPCDACGGQGATDDGARCPTCDGLGGTPCSFCGGTAWPDPTTVPGELRSAVNARQMKHLQRDLGQVSQTAKALAALGKQIGSQTDRRKLTAWFIRLRARILHILRRGWLKPGPPADQLADLARKIESAIMRDT